MALKRYPARLACVFLLLSIIIVATSLLLKCLPSCFLVPREVAFGNVTPSVVVKRLTISNPTRGRVTLVRIESSCTCTVPGISLPQTLESGDELTFDLKLDARRYTGNIARQLTWCIETAEGGQSSISRLTTIVTAIVERPKSPICSPSAVTIGNLGAWETKSEDIMLINQSTSPFVINSIRVSCPELTAEVLSKTKQNAAIRVTLKGSETERGDFDELVIVETSEGEVRLPIQGTHHGLLFMKTPTLICKSDKSSAAYKELHIFHDPSIDSSSIVVHAEGIIAPVVRDRARISSSQTKLGVLFEDLSKLKSKSGRLLISDGRHNDSSFYEANVLFVSN